MSNDYRGNKKPLVMVMTTTADIHSMSSKVLDGLKSYSLSNFDLKHLEPNITITMSDDIPYIRFADELVNQQGIGIMLWKFSPGANSGHWIGFIRNDTNNTFEIFNSYGGRFNTINTQLKIGSSGANPNMLMNLIRNSGYKLILPHGRFQAMKTDDNTCGRWVALRLLFHRYSINEFKNVLQTISRELKINPLDLAILNSIG